MLTSSSLPSTPFRPAQGNTGQPRHRPIVVAIVLIAFGVLILLGALLVAQYTLRLGAPESLSQGVGYDQGFRDGFNKARTIARPLLLPQIAQQPRTALSGTVTAVAAQTVSLTVSDVVADEAVDGVGLERSFRVAPETEIVAVRARTNEEFLAAMREFETWLRNPTEPALSAPSPTVEAEGRLSDIRVGSTLRVEGPQAEDMTLLNDFTATKVFLELAQ